MMNETEWKDFVARARRDGKLIENVIQDVYVSNIDRAGNALDGGAHVGFHTIGLAGHLTRGKVLAVEANAATFKTLQSNAKIRQGGAELRSAAGQPRAPDGHLQLLHQPSGVLRYRPTLGPHSARRSAVRGLGHGACHHHRQARVRQRAVAPGPDQARPRRGGEYHALQGGEATLRRLRPLVVSEHSVHAPVLNGFAIGDYFTWLQSLNYTPLSPGGERVDLNRPFPFWYVFLVPTERLDDWSSRIATSLDKFQ